MARSEDLILIDDLNVALESGTGEVAIEDWWAKVEKLEMLLSGDSRHTKEDMQALQRLKDGITLATLAVREGMKPDTHLARIALFQIQQAIEHRTNWPGWLAREIPVKPWPRLRPLQAAPTLSRRWRGSARSKCQPLPKVGPAVT